MELFPDPKPFRSLDLPDSTPLPGATEESTATLRECLKDNHKRWHTFFNDRGFHNHTAHGLLALWYLGADADILKAAYEQESSYQRATYASPGPINKDNWTEHLGDAKYYDSYLAFFSAELAAKGPTAILEDYVFSEAVNYPENGKPVEMLARLLDGLIHPLIHVGYGYEFGVPGMIVEGLSQAAVHGATSTPILPPSLWKEPSSITQDIPNSTSNLLNILARIIADPEIAPTQGDQAMYQEIVKTYSSPILKHVNSWMIDVSTKEGLRKILEEIAWFVSLIYAVPGYTTKSEEDGTFNADFFYMHLVTSSMFLPPLIAHLKPQSQKLLLKSYITVCLSWFISRGKPTLNIPSFFSSSQTQKSLLTTTTTTPPYNTAPSNNLPSTSTSKISPNPWTEIIHLTLLHPDDHVPKLQRTLMHYSRLYGTRKLGHFNKDTVLKLEGVEKMDGTLFVRAANLSALRLNKGPAPLKIGQETFQSYWDRRGFF
ncbi:hypothetical protein AGABI2DRAFT_212589 [Agaricus bisporus var. bisporus H97]|uniref:hypothetical protein n=1 Tax=Agaricus bisporus var. bisporus (strain H97 / ATCC MYA-4626 / FGSC 10389) TaxID=936046 RepID=UPI00029F739B|nr:hypothetical protein AGABI2DRAFT_212589 [Agaricus bisporus var. bisporus H97]EKV42008.1 hypothetical protein AGABI2DRAFT_212589 [Agaricus bisporus var. bisporus H97]